jgi:hypothetical protein
MLLSLSDGYAVLGRSGAAAACRPWLLIGLALTVLSGCNPFHRPPKLEEPVSLIAVMPIEPLERVSVTPTEVVESLPAEAPRQVTAEIYAVLTSSPEWRVVPDLTVSRALRRIKTEGDLAARSRALGTEVKADAVLFGTVSRYVERVGTEFGARQPASVGFDLQLVSVPSGKILWNGSFDQTQQALSSNLFRWWQFWRGGPRWFTVQEFTRIGAEHVLKNLAQRVE